MPPPNLTPQQRLAAIHREGIQRATATSIQAVQDYVAALPAAHIQAVHAVINRMIGGDPISRGLKDHPIDAGGEGGSDIRYLTRPNCPWSLTVTLLAALFGTACWSPPVLRHLAIHGKLQPPIPFLALWKHLYTHYIQQQQPFWSERVVERACKACLEELGRDLHSPSQKKRGRPSKTSKVVDVSGRTEQEAQDTTEDEISHNQAATTTEEEQHRSGAAGPSTQAGEKHNHTALQHIDEQENGADPTHNREKQDQAEPTTTQKAPNAAPTSEHGTPSTNPQPAVPSPHIKPTSGEAAAAGPEEANSSIAAQVENPSQEEEDDDDSSILHLTSTNFDCQANFANLNMDDSEGLAQYLKQPAKKIKAANARGSLSEAACLWERSGPVPNDDIRTIIDFFSMFSPGIVLLDSGAETTSNPARVTAMQKQQIPSKILFLPRDNVGSTDAATYVCCDVDKHTISVFVSNCSIQAQELVVEQFFAAVTVQIPGIRAREFHIAQATDIAMPIQQKSVVLLLYAIYSMHDRPFPNIHQLIMRRWLSALFVQRPKDPLVDLVVPRTAQANPIPAFDRAQTPTISHATGVLENLKQGATAIHTVLHHLATFRSIIAVAIPDDPVPIESATFARSPAFNDSQSQAVVIARTKFNQRLLTLLMLLLKDEKACKKWLLESLEERKQCLQRLHHLPHVEYKAFLDSGKEEVTSFAVSPEDGELSEGD